MANPYRSKIRQAINTGGVISHPEGPPHWQPPDASGITAEDLDAIRSYRLQRIRNKLIELDYAGIVLTDPINIRYATDSRNMQVWSMRFPMRYCFVATEGPVVLFEFMRCMHLSNNLPLISELRPAVPWLYITAGKRVPELAAKWAAEIADLMHLHGGGNVRLAIDRCNPEGIWVLQRLGMQLCDGEEVMDCARSVKCSEEVKVMRCAVAQAEEAVAVMESHLKPGITEQRLWSYLHAENIARGGEYIETRLLASGPRTNPWYQECSDRVIEAGDLVSFDTDLIGPYGMFVDISRTWLCGDVKPSSKQKELYQTAYEQICFNRDVLKAGMSFRELSGKTMALAPGFVAERYTVQYHGAGLADEYPAIFYPEDWPAAGYDGILEPNTVICVESYIGREGDKEGVKLEEQVLITETGVEPLSRYPFDDRLSAYIR